MMLELLIEVFLLSGKAVREAPRAGVAEWREASGVVLFEGV